MNYTNNLYILEDTDYERLQQEYRESFGKEPTKVQLTTTVYKDEHNLDVVLYTLVVQEINFSDEE